jgi:hypothetical protein
MGKSHTTARSTPQPIASMAGPFRLLLDQSMKTTLLSMSVLSWKNWLAPSTEVRRWIATNPASACVICLLVILKDTYVVQGNYRKPFSCCSAQHTETIQHFISRQPPTACQLVQTWMILDKAGYSEIFAHFYKTTWRHIPEHSNIHTQRLRAVIKPRWSWKSLYFLCQRPSSTTTVLSTISALFFCSRLSWRFNVTDTIKTGKMQWGYVNKSRSRSSASSLSSPEFERNTHVDTRTYKYKYKYEMKEARK